MAMVKYLLGAGMVIISATGCGSNGTSGQNPVATNQRPTRPLQSPTLSPDKRAKLKALWNQGATAKQRGDFKGARRAWQAALNLVPDHPGFQQAIDKLPRGDKAMLKDVEEESGQILRVDKGGFSIWVPGKPELVKKEQTRSGGSVVDIQIWRVINAPFGFVVTCISGGAAAPPEAALNSMVAGMTDGKTNVSQKIISIQGSPAREVEVKGKSKARFIVAGNRYYSFVVDTKDGDLNSPVVDKFLDSFELI